MEVSRITRHWYLAPKREIRGKMIDFVIKSPEMIFEATKVNKIM